MSALSAPAGGGTTTQSKSSTGKSKYQKLDINNLYCHSRGENSEPSSVKSQLSRKHGMQSLGKVPSARRPPANLPSLKTESGHDPTVNSSSAPSQPPAAPPTVTSSVGTTTPTTSTTTTAAAPPVVNPPCLPPNNSSLQHAGAFPAGWAALPPHRTSQFQQEFPSLDGEAHAAAGPSLRPQTEGSWTAGGSRPGVPDGPAQGGDARPSPFNRTLAPSFMYKGSTGAGGPGGFPPAMMSQGPPLSGSRLAHNAMSRGPQRGRETALDKLVQKPIIREEDLRSMDEIAGDPGWATHDDIDYNQKLNFSDDESPKESTPPPGGRHSKHSGQGGPRVSEKDLDKRPSDRQSQPPIIAKDMEDDEMWKIRQRQHSSEMAAVIERAKQRKQQDEMRYQEEQRLQEAAKQKSEQSVSVTSQPSQNAQMPEWDRSKEQEKNSTLIKGDVRDPERSGSHPPTLNRSTSRDNVRSGNESSDFRQMPQINDSRAIRDPKERDRVSRDRDYHKERDFYREKDGPPRIERLSDRDKDSDRGPERDRDRDNRDRDRDRERDRGDRDRDRNRGDNRSERDRDREMRSEREYFKPFHVDVPPRFLKQQQNRGNHNYDRMSSSGSDRGDFNRGSNLLEGSAGSDNDKQGRRNEDNKAPMPFNQQYDNRWNFSGSKGGQLQNNQRGDNFKKPEDQANKGGPRRNRTDSELSSKESDKVDDRRRERHTPDEPRHPRHPPRKLSGSSDTRHSSNRDYDRDDDYRRDKDKDRRSGSSYEDKSHPDYGQQRDATKESGYDWRAEKDFEKSNRNFPPKDLDRQSSRESQKDFNKKNEDKKNVENYEQKPVSVEKLSDVFERKCSVQEDRKSESIEKNLVEKSERQDEEVDLIKSGEKADSPKISTEIPKEISKMDNFEKSDISYDKERDSSNNKLNKSSSERQIVEKSDGSKSDSQRSNYRDHRGVSQRDYKSDSDDSKRNVHSQSKRNIPNMQKNDSFIKENANIDEENNKISNEENKNRTNVEDISKVWSENIKSDVLLNEIKSQTDTVKPEEKDSDGNRIDSSNKDDMGKEKLERKLSSSGSEKKSSSSAKYRSDSGSSKRGYAMVYRGNNWGGRPDNRRRGGSNRPHMSNRDSLHSESEISGDEMNQQPGNPEKKRNARSPKSHSKKGDKVDNIKNNNKDGSAPQSLQTDNNRNFSSKENISGQIGQSKPETRTEGREPFAPRGEPSRRGRGGFRGNRGAVHMVGFGPQSTKSPFGQSNVLQPSGEALDAGDGSKNEGHSEDKNKNKQSNAGVIGRERHNIPPRLQNKNPRNKIKVEGASGEEESWDTTSDHSESGKNKLNKMDNRQLGGHGSKGALDKKQGFSGAQDSKGNQKPFKDKKSDSKDILSEHEIVDDGFQEVRSKKNVKDVKGGQVIKDEIPPIRMHNKHPKNDNQRTNSSSRNSSEKSVNPGGPRNNSGPMSNMKINCPPNERQMVPTQGPNKPNFERMRQNNLPPRLVRQMENMRNQKQQQGFNSGTQNMDMNNVLMNVSAWEKPINTSLRGNLEGDQSIVPGIGNIDCNDICLTENHSGHSSQRSTPNNSIAVEQKNVACLTLEKSGLLDGTTTPVQTIIFENTNYKSAPEMHKQKFMPPGIVQQNNAANQIKNQQCANKSLGPAAHQQPSELDSQILGFSGDASQAGQFITDLINNESSQASNKQDSSPIQLQMPFVSGPKGTEDASDIKLDFTFDSELSQLTDDKGAKSLGLSRSMHTISSSQNSMSSTTELNLKIASVKKVWDNTSSMSAAMEHPTTDEVSHSQHNLNSHNMSVSSPHNLTSQHNINAQHISSPHNLTSQHNLSQQLTSPHAMNQHNLGLGAPHTMSSNAGGNQFSAGFEDHQTVNDVGQSQGFSPSGNVVNNQTTNVCKVKPTQQALHTGPGIAQNLQNMQAALLNQNQMSLTQATATALQSMGGIQGVGGVMGMSPPPPMQHTFNYMNHQNQFGGIPAIPSPPTVVYNSSQQLINTSQQMSSQGGLYGPFPIDQTRNQYAGYPGSHYGAGSAPYNYTPDMFQGLPNQYRMQDIFQASSAAFGQSGQLPTNPSTVLISSTSNSLMSASVKPTNQPIGAIGSKGTSYQGQQYLGYAAPHEAQGPPPTFAPTLAPPSIVRPQAPPHPQAQLQPPSTYYSQNAANQTGFYQQTGNVSANYGIQFGQPNQNHNNAGLQSFGSQVLPSYQMAAAIQQQYSRAAQHPQAYVGAAATTGKQDHNAHLSRPQQLKSPLQDHQNGMFGVANLGAQGVVNQNSFGGGAPSPKGGGTPNSMKGPNSGYVGGPSMNPGNKQGSQHSPPHHKYQSQPPPGQPYQHMSQVIQQNGRQGSLNMALNRGGMQQRYPSPIQRPLPPQSQLYNNRANNNRHQAGNNGQPHAKHTTGGYYAQNKNTQPPVVPVQTPTPEQKPTPVVPEEACTPPATSANIESTVTTVSTSTPPATTTTTTEPAQEKKAE